MYDGPDPGDGVRVLVGRLWPRGLHRDDPRVGRWDKQVAPSTPALEELRALSAGETVTLVTATTQVGDSHLGVLTAVLEGR